MSLKSIKFGFIGAGNMAQALGKGLLAKGLVAPEQLLAAAPERLLAADPENGTLEIWRKWGANTTNSNIDVLESCDVVILAVKPGLFPAAVSYEGIKVKCKLIISVMSGVTIEALEKEFCLHAQVPVVRVMPNTCATVGAGCAVFSRGKNVTNEQCDIVKALFESVGICKEVPESQINAYCGLTGSGPAYIYTIIEALSDGGVKMGIDRGSATRFAAQLVSGAAKMVLDTGRHPASLRDDVCSPGGTTITAVHELEKGNLRSTLMSAVEAAANKANQQGK
ncbi:pyrroline-5-carboxylate reductase 3-like isoform X2 [Artemia franciscana]|uniref:pyrroline-5-carboxylate reductase 3-like isoform X2 n=1 Tax=Artemia franciscana TaxID=6661 RepID=UPI0032DB7A48